MRVRVEVRVEVRVLGVDEGEDEGESQGGWRVVVEDGVQLEERDVV